MARLVVMLTLPAGKALRKDAHASKLRLSLFACPDAVIPSGYSDVSLPLVLMRLKRNISS
jgi:hypothetical protein